MNFTAHVINIKNSILNFCFSRKYILELFLVCFENRSLRLCKRSAEPLARIRRLCRMLPSLTRFTSVELCFIHELTKYTGGYYF